MPLGIFGILAALDGLLILCLPETKGKEMPDTMRDAEDFDTQSVNLTTCRRNCSSKITRLGLIRVLFLSHSLRSKENSSENILGTEPRSEGSTDDRRYKL